MSWIDPFLLEGPEPLTLDVLFGQYRPVHEAQRERRRRLSTHPKSGRRAWPAAKAAAARRHRKMQKDSRKRNRR